MATSGELGDDLTVTVVITGDVASVSVIGELDVFSVPQLSRAITRELESGTSRIVVDLSGLSFIDSYSIETLVGLTVAAAAAGVDLAFSSPGQQFLRVKQLVDSNHVLRVDGV